MESIVNNVLSWEGFGTKTPESKKQNSDLSEAANISDTPIASNASSAAIAEETSDETDLAEIEERDVEIARSHEDDDDDEYDEDAE